MLRSEASTHYTRFALISPSQVTVKPRSHVYSASQTLHLALLEAWSDKNTPRRPWAVTPFCCRRSGTLRFFGAAPNFAWAWPPQSFPARQPAAAVLSPAGSPPFKRSKAEAQVLR